MPLHLHDLLHTVLTLAKTQRSRGKQSLEQVKKRAPLIRGTVSPPLPVPGHITQPPYVGKKDASEIASEIQMHDKVSIIHMKAACELAARVLEYAGTLVKVSLHFSISTIYVSLEANYSMINYSFSKKFIASFYQPSVTTDEIDKAVHKMIIDAGAYPSPLGYGGFPKSVCTSVNECICHGIPDSRELQVLGEAYIVIFFPHVQAYHPPCSTDDVIIISFFLFCRMET